MSRLLTLTLTALLTLAMASWTQAQGGDKAPRERRGERAGQRDGDGDRDGRRGPGGALLRIIHALDLNDSQKQAVRECMTSHREKAKAFYDEHADEFKAIREKMQAARQADDREAMKAAFEEFRALRSKGPKPEDLIACIRGNLEGDQVTRFDEAIAKLKERFEDRGPRPGGDRPRRGPRDGENNDP